MRSVKLLPKDAEFKIEFGGYIESEFREAYPYIYPELPAIWYYEFFMEWNIRRPMISDTCLLDLMQDFIMANGMADYQE